MTTEEKMKSTNRGLTFLKLAVQMEPDIRRGLYFYTLIQNLFGFAAGATIAGLIAMIV